MKEQRIGNLETEKPGKLKNFINIFDSTIIITYIETQPKKKPNSFNIDKNNPKRFNSQSKYSNINQVTGYRITTNKKRSIKS